MSAKPYVGKPTLAPAGSGVRGWPVKSEPDSQGFTVQVLILEDELLASHLGDELDALERDPRMGEVDPKDSRWVYRYSDSETGEVTEEPFPFDSAFWVCAKTTPAEMMDCFEAARCKCEQTRHSIEAEKEAAL